MAGTASIDSTVPAGGTEAARPFVSLVDVDPDLADGIPAADLPLARRALARPVHTLQDGGFDVEALLGGENSCPASSAGCSP